MKDILILGQKIMNEQCRKLFDKWIKGYGMYAHEVYSSEAFEAGWKAHENFSSAEGINFILEHVIPHDSIKTNK